MRGLDLPDRTVILDTGGVVFDGRAAEVLGDEKLRSENLAIRPGGGLCPRQNTRLIFPHRTVQR